MLPIPVLGLRTTSFPALESTAHLLRLSSGWGLLLQEAFPDPFGAWGLSLFSMLLLGTLGGTTAMATVCFNRGFALKLWMGSCLLAFPLFRPQAPGGQGLVLSHLCIPKGYGAPLISVKYLMFLKPALEARHSDFQLRALFGYTRQYK